MPNYIVTIRVGVNATDFYEAANLAGALIQDVEVKGEPFTFAVVSELSGPGGGVGAKRG